MLWRSSSPCTGRWDDPWRSHCSLSACTPHSPLERNHPEFKQSITAARVTHMRLTTLCSAEALGAKFLSNLLRKSYCLIWESWGKSQLHTEGKTIEEETLQLISLSPLLLPNTETKVCGSKPVSSKQEEVKRRTITLLSEDSPFIFLLRDTLFCFLSLENFGLPPGPFIPASCRPVTTF